MVVSFHTKKLQKNCNSDREMQKNYGKAKARKLQQRLMELGAADHLGQISHLPPPRCHEMTGNRKGQLSVDLDQPYRLFFVPANDPVPMKKGGGLDWTAVTKIEIVEIEDPH